MQDNLSEDDISVKFITQAIFKVGCSPRWIGQLFAVDASAYVEELG